MKKFKSYIFLLIFMVVIGFIIFSVFLSGVDKYQYLNSIDYHVEMQKDGSMRVTETWDVDIKNTNTLFAFLYYYYSNIFQIPFFVEPFLSIMPFSFSAFMLYVIPSLVKSSALAISICVILGFFLIKFIIFSCVVSF